MWLARASLLDATGSREGNGTWCTSSRRHVPPSSRLRCERDAAAGSALDPNPERDVRLNVLRIHDEKQAGDPTFAAALAEADYDPAGLLATVESQGKSVLCASCHLS